MLLVKATLAQEFKGEKEMKKIALALITILMLSFFVGCEYTNSDKDIQATGKVGDILQGNQPTPTDIQYSLERFNLIRRAYWVNGQREKAMSLVIPIQRPLGYVILLSDSGAVVGRFIVDGKVSSLRNYLTPISEYYTANISDWLVDTDGTYGDNPEGIFFFTNDGKYVEWSGSYLFSDIPFDVADPILKTEGK